MALLGSPEPIETAEHILRARRTAAVTRVAMGLLGIVLIVNWPGLDEHPVLGVIGFATVMCSAAVQLAAPRLSWLTLEESLSAGAGVLIIGFGAQRVDVVAILWLVAVASGVLARGGRVHWIGRAVLMCALFLPIVRMGELEPEYAGMFVATIGLLLTAGRLTGELNMLLRQARMQADSAETLLLAGDIASRMSDHVAAPGEEPAPQAQLTEAEQAGARIALARLIEGEGLSMVVQPIVDIETGQIHAYEALARFGQARPGEGRPGATPLHWFALAEQLGGRPALERACLREALVLLDRRPAGSRLSVNLSTPVLLEAPTLEMLEEAAAARPERLDGLIVEITEETLIETDDVLKQAIGPLLAHGAVLAVDDMGAGYSGLRQITTVRPAYLKLDRSLATGIDGDPERSALVSALAGYARQVGAILIVEGIETTAELQVLRKIGVQLVQGFRLSRPGEPWPEIDADDARGTDPRRPGRDMVLGPDLLDPADWKTPVGDGLERSSAGSVEHA
jgi:EAL domain-containing protein (putative c-di-GMP-specific phosphodiesterase class I)